MDQGIIDYEAVLSPLHLQIFRDSIEALEPTHVPLEWVRALLATISYQESAIRGYQDAVTEWHRTEAV